MRKIIKYTLIIFSLWLLFKIFFFNFIIKIDVLENTYGEAMPETFPGGILSPVAVFKVKRNIYDYILKNESRISKFMMPDKLEIDKFKILSIVD